MKNKFLIALLAIVCALCCALGFAACDFGTNPDDGGGNKTDSSTCEHEFGFDAFENGELGHFLYCKKCGDKINKPHEYDDSLMCIYCKYHVHDYSAQTVSNTYFIEKANCEHGDLYYVSCKLCGQSSKDKTFENGTAKHDLTHVKEKVATCYEKGNKEYWTCNTCERYFADEECQDEISDKTTVEYEIKTHEYSNSICNLCGKAQDKDITYTFVLNDDKQSYTLRAVRGSDVKGEMTLPAEFNAMPVTRIEGIAGYGQIYVFDGAEITDIIIPEGVTYIGIATFVNCNLLKSIIIPESVTSIDRQAFYKSGNALDITVSNATVCGEAFYECNLNNVTVGNGATSVGGVAFYKCSIKNAVIGTGITNFGTGVFRECSGMESVTVPFIKRQSDNYNYSFGYNWFNNKVPSTLKTVTVTGTGDTAIESNSINCEYIESINLGDGIAAVCDRAFYGCTALKNITIGSGLETIEYGAFSYCDGVENLTVDSNNPNFTYDGGIIYSKDKTNVVAALQKIKDEIILPAEVKSIGARAFSGCSLITGVTIGNNATSIGENAFEGCAALASINYIGNLADWCKISGLHYLMSFGKQDRTLYINGSKPTGELVIPEGVTAIESYAFYNCDELTSVTIPDSVSSIGISAFKGCASIESIVLPFVGNELNGTENTHLGYIFGASTYSDNKKSLPETLNSVTINGGSSIDGNAFYECASLTSVTLGNGVVSIGDRAFYDCDLLENINYTGNIKSWCEIDGLTNLLKYGLNNKKMYLNGEEVTELIIPDGVTAIGENTFRNLSSVTSVTIGSNVVSIGDYAFSGCSGLTSVTIPDGVNSIGDCVFRGCSRLTSVSIPDGVNLIGERAFDGCGGLTSVTIPGSLTSISENAFYNCRSLTDINYTGDIASWCKISGLENLMFEGSSNKKLYLSGEEVTELVIPDSVTSIGEITFWSFSSLTGVTIGNGVISISGNAFYNCRSLTDINYTGDIASWCKISGLDNLMFEGSSNKKLYLSGEEVTELVIPDGVTSICDAAFGCCTSITSVTIPDSVIKIGDSAFSGCTSITSVTISDGVTEIGNSAFSGCTSITSVTIPDSVTEIGGAAFKDCTKLESITLPFVGNEVNGTDNTHFGYIFGAGIYSNNKYYLPESLTSVTVNGGSLIDESAFYECKSLASVTLGDGVVSIGDEAFCWSSLTYITIPNSVVSIGQSAFAATNLEQINYTGDMSNWCKISGLGNLMPYGLWNKKLYINEEEVKGELIIPDGVTFIGDYALCNCISLTGITIPDSVTSIGRGAFDGCTSLEYNEYDNALYLGNNNNPYLVLIKAQDTDITSCNINENTKFIYSRAFSSCSSLTDVTIPDSVISIGDYAFENCSGLTEIIIPDSVTEIGYDAFSGCQIENAAIPAFACKYINSSNLKTVVITSGDSIDEGAFGQCTLLTSVTIPDSIISIGDNAFVGCSSITSIEIPDSVTKIGDYTFDYCMSLRTIILPNGLTSIGEGAFYHCVSLTNIIIPDSVTKIGDYAFEDCMSLEYNEYDNSLYLGNSYNPYLVLIKVQDTGITSCNINENTKFIYTRAFSGCGSLTGIAIPDSITSIGAYAFENCIGFTDITIPDSVTEIGDCAFEGCQIENAIIPAIACKYINNFNLKTVVITSGDSLGEWAFTYCAQLVSVTIPDGVTSIGDYAFNHCIELKSINIPDSVTSIGNYLFDECFSLASINFEGTKEQWMELKANSYWNESIIGNYTITCSDGTISKYE